MVQLEDWFQIDCVCIVYQAVQYSIRQCWITYEFMPGIHRELARDESGAQPV